MGGTVTVRSDIDLLKPRFRWGNITPTRGRVERGPGYQFYRVVPLDVMVIETTLGLEDYTVDGVDAALQKLDSCADALRDEEVDCVTLAGAPISAQLGRPKLRTILDDIETRVGVPAGAPLESVIAAMRHLGVARLAVGSRWSAELNDAVATYLADGGVEVGVVTSRDQWAKQAFGMSLEEGLRMAVEVGREAAISDPGCDAIYIAGGASMALHAIPVLEGEFHKPVFTNLNVGVWSCLVHPGVIDPVAGWGTLLTRP